MHVLAVFFFLSTGASAPGPLWDYHFANFHEAVEARDWYRAKTALGYLRSRHPERYREKKLDLAAATVAAREGHWDSVFRYNLQSGSVNPFSRVEMIQSLVVLGRHREALDWAEKNDIRFNGEAETRLLELKAECYKSLGLNQQAVKAYRSLTRGSMPVNIRVAATSELVALYYRLGSTREARRLAEKVQAKTPYGDAAMFTMNLQRGVEDQAYLSRSSTLDRFAKVAYANRNFELSDQLFDQIIAGSGPDKSKNRARYYKAVTRLKQGDADGGVNAFGKELPKLKDTGFEGQAAFQYARALFLAGRDEEAAQFSRDFRRRERTGKWRNEIVRLLILATRRRGDLDAYRALGAELRKDRAPRWLMSYYHRNGVVWAMQDGRHQDAVDHLNQYAGRRPKGRLRQEADLWRGLIDLQRADKAKAMDAWMKIVARDPNHYFGLVAREFIQASADALNHDGPVARLKRDRLLALYFQGGPEERASAAAELQRRECAEELDWRDYGDDIRDLLEIGRYDWAAYSLKRGGLSRRQYQFTMARWLQLGGQYHESLNHAEVLVNSYPNWLPHELLPDQVQKLMYPLGYERIVREKAALHGVDPYLLLAIIREESHFNQHAHSWASARGLMQFIPSTAEAIAGELDTRDFTLHMLYEPETAIALGARYVEKLMENFDGAALYAVAAYNAGEGAVDRWRGFSPEYDPLQFVWDVSYTETKNYCQKVLRAYHHYTRVYEHRNTSLGDGVLAGGGPPIRGITTATPH